ncbi:hypothetical protein ACYBV0_28860 [Klebsiella pneumoniae]
MNNSAMPSSLTVVFSASGDKNTIPVNSTPETLADGLAAMDSGFPPLTRIALSAGGKPPKGQDFNGIFNDAYTRAMGASRRFLYIRLCIFGSYRWIPKRRDSYQFSQGWILAKHYRK